MVHHRAFQAVDAAIIRIAAYPDNLLLPPWPDVAEGDIPSLVAWVREVWPLPGVAEVIEVASPDLARAIAVLCEDPDGCRPRQARRAAEALMRYLLRWTSRATPFGLFAGITPVTLAASASVRLGSQHTAVNRPDSACLTEMIDTLESQPDLLRQIPVMVNNLGFARGEDWVLPCQPSAQGTVSDVCVRATAPVRAVVQEARTPVVFGDLLAKLAAGSPRTPVPVIEAMLSELVRRRILLTSLRPPMTVTDPRAHVTVRAGGAPAAVPPGSRSSCDLRLDCEISVPPPVFREAEAAAEILVRVAPGRPAWHAYHAAFIDRYGPGALVPVLELVDPGRGLGYPAGFRGSLYRNNPPPARREITLAALAQESAMDQGSELVIDEKTAAMLETGDSYWTVPHTELRFSLSAASPAALDKGQFSLLLASASRHAGTSVGRFLHLLSPAERDLIAGAYRALPVSTEGGLAVQISSPVLSARAASLALVPQILPLLSLGEHREPQETAVDIDDLTVTADAHRLMLVSLSRGCAIEPLILNAVDLRHGAHPLSRFLCEVSTGTSAPCTPFSWGRVAGELPFLPRVRHGRTILRPARWNLADTTLPGPAAATSAWTKEFGILRKSRHIPDRVRFGTDDVVIGLDLTDLGHLALLRRHLTRTGTAAITEDIADCAWIGGRPHEIVLPLASAAPPRQPVRPLTAGHAYHGPGHLPGSAPWLYAKLSGDPASQTDLLTSWLPALLADWPHGDPDDWWFIRYTAPAPHLRVRLHLHDASRYGPAARSLARRAGDAHHTGLLSDITLETYRPETGRFGAGAAMAAAEAVFAADSAVAVAQLRGAGNVQAVTASGMTAIAAGFAGAGWAQHLRGLAPHGGTPPLDRDLLKQARQPADVPQALLDRRRTALAAYRSVLGPAEARVILADLLHLHHARMIGTGAESERTCLRLARAITQIPRGERNDSSKSANRPLSMPAA
jgi:lantibiotic biosynthesis protein